MATLDYAHAGRTLSAAQLQQYDRDGYLVVRKLVPADELEKYRCDTCVHRQTCAQGPVQTAVHRHLRRPCAARPAHDSHARHTIGESQC
jgi:hypothetical protein